MLDRHMKLPVSVKIIDVLVIFWSLDPGSTDIGYNEVHSEQTYFIYIHPNRLVKLLPCKKTKFLITANAFLMAKYN